jgi:hypothetical protein
MKQPAFSLAYRDPAVAARLAGTPHRTLAIWAADCAARVLPYFETARPADDRPRHAIETCRAWARTGVFSMKVIRGASLGSHAAAREVGEDSPARSAARAAGQAAATPHVPTHAIGAASYAAQAVFRASNPEEAGESVAREREWQYRRLVELGGE